MVNKQGNERVDNYGLRIFLMHFTVLFTYKNESKSEIPFTVCLNLHILNDNEIVI